MPFFGRCIISLFVHHLASSGLVSAWLCAALWPECLFSASGASLFGMCPPFLVSGVSLRPPVCSSWPAVVVYPFGPCTSSFSASNPLSGLSPLISACQGRLECIFGAYYELKVQFGEVFISKYGWHRDSLGGGLRGEPRCSG